MIPRVSWCQHVLDSLFCHCSIFTDLLLHVLIFEYAELTQEKDLYVYVQRFLFMCVHKCCSRFFIFCSKILESKLYAPKESLSSGEPRSVSSLQSFSKWSGQKRQRELLRRSRQSGWTDTTKKLQRQVDDCCGAGWAKPAAKLGCRS